MSRTKQAKISDTTLFPGESFQVMVDASGAPAVLSFNGYVFAMDFLGEVKMSLIKPVYGSRVANKIAAERCQKRYLAILAAQTDTTWRAANSAMYEV